jgi:hypothetical protein
MVFSLLVILSRLYCVPVVFGTEGRLVAAQVQLAERKSGELFLTNRGVAESGTAQPF